MYAGFAPLRTLLLLIVTLPAVAVVAANLDLADTRRAQLEDACTIVKEADHRAASRSRRS